MHAPEPSLVALNRHKLKRVFGSTDFFSLFQVKKFLTILEYQIKSIYKYFLIIKY